MFAYDCYLIATGLVLREALVISRGVLSDAEWSLDNAATPLLERIEALLGASDATRALVDQITSVERASAEVPAALLSRDSSGVTEISVARSHSSIMELLGEADPASDAGAAPRSRRPRPRRRSLWQRLCGWTAAGSLRE